MIKLNPYHTVFNDIIIELKQSTSFSIFYDVNPLIFHSIQYCTSYSTGEEGYIILIPNDFKIP